MLAQLQEVYDHAVGMDLSCFEERQFQASKTFHIFNKYFKKQQLVVKDHCHSIGKFEEAAHNQCHLSYRNASSIPVVFHNST